MIPILYKANELEFTSNGIGPLADAITCDVIEERNGVYELEMQYPIDGIHYSDLSEDRYIYATVSDNSTNKQAFKIYKITRPINGVVTVYAEHISYLLNKIIIMPYTAGSCAEALTRLPNFTVDTCPFTFTTDKRVDAEFTVTEPTPVRSLLGGSSGSILDVYGKGEYEFDMWNVRLLTNRGRNDNVVLLYGKNITELERTTDMTNVYTGIVPFWKGGDDDVVTLPEKVIWSDKADTYSYKIAKVVDFSSDWEGAPTFVQLRARANNYISKNEGWKIKDNIKVSFVNLADTVEFKDKASLMRVRLCDTVTVRYTKLGVDVEAKVVKTNWNTLKNRYNEIEIGEASSSFYKAIVEENVNPIIENTSNFLQDELRRQGKLLSGGLGGYVVLNRDADGTPRELLVMNTPDKETATEILVINKNGIGFTDRYGGTPNSAWTLDGSFSANFIKTGAINANLITTGYMKFDRALGGTLKLGGTVNGTTGKNGTLIVYDSTDKECGRWGANGISIIRGNITLGVFAAGSGRTGSSKTESTSGAGAKITNDGRVYAGSLDLYYGKSGNTNLFSHISADPDKAGRLNIYRGAVLGGEKATGRSYAHGLTVFGGPKCETSGKTQGFVTQTDSYFLASAEFENSTLSEDKYCVTVKHGLRCTRKAGPWALFVDNQGYIYNSFCYSHTTGKERTHSDRRLKKNIEPISIDESKKFIYGLRPTKYSYKEDDDNEIRHGFIAQDVLEVADWSIVSEFKQDDIDYLALEYQQIIADLVNVVQAQHKEIEELKEAVYGKASN